MLFKFRALISSLNIYKKVQEIQFSHSSSLFFKPDHLSTLTCFFGLDQLLTFGKFICLKYSSSARESSHMLLAPASTIIIRPEDTVLRMLRTIVSVQIKSLTFCLKHQGRKRDFKTHLHFKEKFQE